MGASQRSEKENVQITAHSAVAHSQRVTGVLRQVSDKSKVGLTLIESGVIGVNDRGRSGGTALHAACYAQWTSGVSALLRMGADPAIRALWNRGAVDAAVLGGSDKHEALNLAGLAVQPQLEECVDILRLLLASGEASRGGIGRDIKQPFILQLRAVAQLKGFTNVVSELRRTIN